MAMNKIAGKESGQRHRKGIKAEYSTFISLNNGISLKKYKLQPNHHVQRK